MPIAEMKRTNRHARLAMHQSRIFLPGGTTDLVGERISNSRAGTWRRCEKKFEFKYVMELEAKEKKRSLEFGSWMHVLLEEHYEGRDWKIKHKEMTAEFYKLFEEEREELGDLPTDCARLMRSYLRYWREEDAQFRVIDTELDEIVTLPSGLEFRIIVDMIVEDLRTGFLWPWDHKNRKNFVAHDAMLIDPQLTNYFTGLEILGYGPLGGVCYNELRTKAPTVPKILTGKGPKQGTLSKAKIDTDVYTYYRAIKANGLSVADYGDILRQLQKSEEERFFRRVRLPKDRTMKRIMMAEMVQTAREIKERREDGRPYVRTQNNQCPWDCDFKSLCISQLHGGDLKSIIRQGFRKRKETDEAQEKK